jgi:hypothetical protein
MPEEIVLIGDKWARKIEKGFLQWIEDNEDKKPDEWGKFNLKPFIQGAFEEATGVAESQFSDMGIGMKFNLRSPLAENWIRLRAAQDIQYIDATSKKAIRQIILRGFEEGITHQKQAQLIRQYIGLDPRRATALENYEKALIESGASPQAIEKAVLKYRKKLIADRAEVIALTEGHMASNEGYRQANEEAVRRGIIDPNEYERYWMVTRDKRLCPLCEARAGDTAPIGGQFSKGGNGAPLHPRCRCTEGLRSRSS